MNIYLKNLFVDIEEKEFKYMLKNNIIEYNEKTKKYHIVENSDFMFLYQNKSKNKTYFYLSQMARQNFICQCCNKPHSYSISPYIAEDGRVEFNKVICVCKECRFDKLQKRNIIKPIFKQKINWKKEHTQISNDIEKYKIREEDENYYRNLCCNIIILERYVTLILPKNKNYKEVSNKPIDLSNLEVKKDFKLELYRRNRRCPICGKLISYNKFTIDHIIAKKLGGQDTEDNLMGMCLDCNKEKGHKTVMEFLCSKELRFFDSKLLEQAYIQQENCKVELNKLKEIKYNLENQQIDKNNT